MFLPKLGPQLHLVIHSPNPNTSNKVEDFGGFGFKVLSITQSLLSSKPLAPRMPPNFKKIGWKCL